jgi:hypothetical protein
MTKSIEVGDLVKAKKTFSWDQNQFEWGEFFGESWEYAIIVSVDHTNLDNIGPVYRVRFIDGESIFVYENNVELISKCGKNSRDNAAEPLEEKIFYVDSETGYRVLTEEYLINRGWCCNLSCRHCPYKDKSNE